MELSALPGRPARESPESLAAFLRSHRSALLAEWEAAARQRSAVARQKSHPVLLDHMPHIVERIADGLERRAAGAHQSMGELLAPLADVHALQRLDRGFDLADVVYEYSLLRQCIVRAIGGSRSFRPADVEFLAAAIDFAIAQAVTTYTHMQQRTLEALDRISVAAIESADVGTLLQQLLAALLDLVPAVDGGDIRLLEQGALVVRAALAAGGNTAAADRVAGEVAREGAARTLRPADGSPVRVLLAVPLVDAGEVIGVATMASSTTDAFSDGDRRLFDVLCHRASALITQHALHARLQQSENRFRTTFERAAAGIAHVHPDGGWLRVNPRFREMLGYAEQELLALDFRDITHPDDLAEDLALRARLLSGEIGEFTREKRYLRKDGGSVWVRVRASRAQDRPDGPPYLLLVAEDITRLKQAESERDRLLVQERTARGEAQSAVSVREDLLAIVSHDLRNPLGTIRMSAALLSRKLPPSRDEQRLRQLLDLIERATTRMELLITDLMDMTRLKTGRLELDIEEIPAALLVQDAIEFHQPLALERQISLSAELPAAALPVCCDRRRVQQVFANLVGNAIKFTPAGGAIVVGTRARPDEVEFTVRDTGPGIDERDLPHLFQAYWSASENMKKGTGLGLFISKGIVEAHGGTMGVTTRVGEGTTFRFTLPRPSRAENGDGGHASGTD